jgi:hypothetical protein
LVQVNDEHNVISEATDASHGGHSNDEGKQVIYKGIDEFVDQYTPR